MFLIPLYIFKKIGKQHEIFQNEKSRPGSKKLELGQHYDW